jgi:hypothetical protein
MGHSVTGLIAKPTLLEAFASRFSLHSPAPLNQGLAFLPLRDEDIDSFVSPPQSGYAEGFTYLSEQLAGVHGEMVPRPILPMTSSKTKDSRFRNAPDGCETCQSVSPGHKPKHGSVRRTCFNESMACDSERESLKYQAAIGV